MGRIIGKEEMRELWQFTKLIRSKNAGPFELTFDLMFKDRESYERVLKSRVVSAERIAQLYGVPVAEVRRFEIDLIRRALDQTGGHQSRAARLLGMNPTTLNSKIKTYNINLRP